MNAERIKSIEIVWEQHFKFLAAFCGTVFLIVATWAVISWKAHDDKRQQIYDDLGDAAKNLKTISQNVVDGTAQIAPTLKGLQADESEVKDLIAALNNETVQSGASLRERLITVDGFIAKLGGVADEGKHQLKQNGDSVNKTIEESTKAVASLNKTITDADTTFTRLGNDGSLLLETANPRVRDILDHADAMIIDADGRIKAFEPIQSNLTGITSDFNRMTTDSANKLHSILYPEPVKGFWPNVKRAVGYVLTPALEGTRIYFQLKSLPVRITQPVPIFKTP
jgi:ABC-type transporter Mla subunit MlaD